MPAPTVKFHRLARWDLEQVPEPQQQAVREAIDSVLSRPQRQWPAERVQLKSPEKALYLFEATPEWRVIFKLTPSGEVEIAEIVHEERLRWLTEKWRAANGKQ